MGALVSVFFRGAGFEKKRYNREPIFPWELPAGKVYVLLGLGKYGVFTV